jgi:hypothetical protein
MLIEIIVLLTFSGNASTRVSFVLAEYERHLEVKVTGSDIYEDISRFDQTSEGIFVRSALPVCVIRDAALRRLVRDMEKNLGKAEVRPSIHCQRCPFTLC